MLDSEILEKLQGSSVEDRIRVIEAILNTIKHDVRSPESINRSQRPAFGFMKGKGKILGDVIAPIFPENPVDCD
jgi:hypothetical protein